jgi:hypothetical protein
MNLVRTLLQHRWKAFLRSPALDQQLVAVFLLGLLVLVIGATLFALGQNLREVLAQLFPGRDPVATVNGAILYYLLLDLIGRYFVQRTPTARVAPYRHLPVRRAALIRFVLAQVPLTLFNALPWLVAGPFVATLVYPEFGFGAALGWVVTFAALLLINSYLIFLTRLLVAVRPGEVLATLSLVMLLILLDRYELISLSGLSIVAFGAVMATPLWAVLPGLLLGILIIGAERWMNRAFYAEDVPAPPMRSGLRRLDTTRLQQRYGGEGLLMLNELKLITRHRRPRTVIVSSLLIIIAYALLFYTDENDMQLGNSDFLLPGVAITGSVVLTYGQFLLAWEGAYFDGLLAAHVSSRTYIKSKHRLLSAFCLVNYLITLPLGLLGWPLLVVNTACFLFNWGVSSWMILFFATSNRERVNLTSSSFFNSQGVSTVQLWLSLLVLLIPVLLGSLGNWWIPGAGVALVGTMGILGWFMRRVWLTWVVRRFGQKKYVMAAGFRQKTD